MGLGIEGGIEVWGYHEPMTQNFEPISGIPEEYLQSENIFLAPIGGLDVVRISKNGEGIDLSLYLSRMTGHPSLEVVEIFGDVKPNPDQCPSLFYKLGPGEASVHIGYGAIERLIIINSVVNQVPESSCR